MSSQDQSSQEVTDYGSSQGELYGYPSQETDDGSLMNDAQTIFILVHKTSWMPFAFSCLENVDRFLVRRQGRPL